MRILIWVMMGLVVTGMAAGRTYAAEDGDELVTGRVVADVTGIEGGKAFTVAVELSIAPGWHIYWKNPGDAGLPTSFKWDMPEGFTVEDVQWPLPRKFGTGDIAAFGYGDSPVFLATVHPPKEVAAGAKFSLKVKAKWLVCKDVCKSGSADLELSLPAGKEAASGEAEKVAEVRAALPLERAPKYIQAQVRVTGESEKGGEAFQLTFGGPTGAAVDAFPLPLDAVAVEDLKAEPVTGQGAVIVTTFNVRVLAGHKLGAGDILHLLVVYEDPKEKIRRGFWVDVDLKELKGQ